MKSLVGHLIPPHPWTGIVVGVSGKAVSILHPDGALVSVVRGPNFMESRAFCPAGGWPGFAREAERLIGAEGTGGAALAWNGLNLAPARGERLDLFEPLVWDPRPSLTVAASGLARADPKGVEAARSLIGEQVLRAHADGRPRLGIHGDGPFSAAFARLAGQAAFPANLVGFGAGLTPSGDDWLAGFLAASDLAAGGPGRAAGALRRSIRAALQRTTAAGRALLLGALEGSPPAYLVELALDTARLAISGSGRRQEATDALGLSVAEALKHGSSSGEDALLGFAAGLRPGTWS